MLDYGEVFSAALMFAGVVGNFFFSLWPLLFLSMLLQSRWPARRLPLVALALWSLFLVGRLIGLAFNYDAHSFLIPEPWNSVLFGATGVGIVILIFAARAFGQRKDAASSRQAQRNLRFRQFSDVSPTDFERAIADLFRKKGFAVRVTGRTGDGGVDLEISRDNLRAIVQCKRYTNKAVDVGTVRDFYGALTARGASHGYFVTTSYFTRPAQEFARNKPLTLIDRTQLEKWLDEADSIPEPVPQRVDRSATQSTRRILGMTIAQVAILSGLALLMICTLGALLAILLRS